MLDGHWIWVSDCLNVVLLTEVQVEPAVVVIWMTPPSPTSTQVVELVQAMPIMSAFDGTQV